MKWSDNNDNNDNAKNSQRNCPNLQQCPTIGKRKTSEIFYYLTTTFCFGPLLVFRFFDVCHINAIVLSLSSYDCKQLDLSEWTEYLYAFVIVCFHTKLLYSIHLNGTLDICVFREFRLERLLLCVYSSSRLFFLQKSLFILPLPIDFKTSPVKQSTIFIIRIPGNERELPSRKNGQNQENKNTFLHVPR